MIVHLGGTEILSCVFLFCLLHAVVEIVDILFGPNGYFVERSMVFNTSKITTSLICPIVHFKNFPCAPHERSLDHLRKYNQECQSPKILNKLWEL